MGFPECDAIDIRVSERFPLREARPPVEMSQEEGQQVTVRDNDWSVRGMLPSPP